MTTREDLFRQIDFLYNQIDQPQIQMYVSGGNEAYKFDRDFQRCNNIVIKINNQVYYSHTRIVMTEPSTEQLEALKNKLEYALTLIRDLTDSLYNKIITNTVQKDDSEKESNVTYI